MSQPPRRPGKAAPTRRAPSRGGAPRLSVVGLVGGIGSGKSRVAAAMAKRGAFVLDADAIGHTLINQKPARDRVVERFGRDVLLAPETPGDDPTINRTALGAIVFQDAKAREDLEAILHPLMKRTFEKAMERASRHARNTLIVLDAAILFEAGWNSLCDHVVFVDAPREIRLARVQAQRNWTDEGLAAREQAQWPLEKKREKAGIVIENAGTPEELDTAIDAIWDRIKDWAPPSRRGSP